MTPRSREVPEPAESAGPGAVAAILKDQAGSYNPKTLENHSPKVVIVAAMRKLIDLLNAMLRERVEWNQLKVVQNLA